MINPIGTVRWIYDRVNLIFALVNALLTLQETGGSVTTDGTEQDIYRVEAPFGVFEPIKVRVNFTNQTAAETVIVRTYYRDTAGGAYVKKDGATFAGVQDPALKNIKLEPNRQGIGVTIERIAGAAQDYPWAAFFRS